MRQIIYSPQVADDLLRLKSTKSEREAIKAQVKLLAARPKVGFRLLIRDVFLEDDALYQDTVGRFKLNYAFSRETLYVASVLL